MDYYVSDEHHEVAKNFDDIMDEKPERVDTGVLNTLFETLVVLEQNDLGDLADVWNGAYPDVPMDELLPGYIALGAIDTSKKFDPFDPVKIRSVLSKLRKMKLGALSDMIHAMLHSVGFEI